MNSNEILICKKCLDIIELSSNSNVKHIAKELMFLVMDTPTSFDVLTKEEKDLCRAGKKIEAIKVYRQRTGLSLMECKTNIEKLGFGK